MKALHRRTPWRWQLEPVAVETVWVLAALAVLLALGLAQGVPVLRPLRESRFAGLLVVGVVLWWLATFRSGRLLSVRETIRDWSPIAGALLVYESLKVLHANRITAWLGIPPRDDWMLSADRLLFGRALPLWLDGWNAPWFVTLQEIAYSWVYLLGPVACLGFLYFARGDRRQFFATRRGLVLTLLGGYVVYLLVPVAGPLYTIGDRFRHPISTQPAGQLAVFDALRYLWDCFPSLHTAVPWVLTALAWGAMGRAVRVVAVGCAVLVTFSTVGLRFHYGIDVLAGLAWAAMVVAMVRRLDRADGKGRLPVPLPRLDLAGVRARFETLSALFVLSGVSGLLQEQAFEKLMGTLVGTSTPASATVLAVYFLGFSLGAASYGAHLRGRGRSAIRTYSVLEGGVGLWALLMYLLVGQSWRWLELLWAPAAGHPLALGAARLVVAAILMLPPTFLMGATFPAVADGLRQMRLRDPGRLAARLYGLNLLGAVLGAAAGPYVVFPGLGLDGVFLLCAAVGLALFLVASRMAAVAPAVALPDPDAAVPRGGLAAPLRVLTVVAGVSGFLFFSLEVLWVHLIGTVIGTSVYAFGIMLTLVLTGLYAGTLVVAGARPTRRGLPPWLPGALAMAAAGVLALTAPLWPLVPHLLALAGGDFTRFAQGELLRFAIAAVLVLPASWVLGTLFPLIFRLDLIASDLRAAVAGRMTAWNTVGCALGALGTSFVVLPRAGSEGALLGIAVAYAVCGLALWLTYARGWRLAVLGLASCTLVLVGTARVPSWDRLALTSGENVYLRPHQVFPESKLRFFHEDAYGGMTTVVENPPGINGHTKTTRTLLTNGKFQGNDDWEVDAQAGFALAPLLHCQRFDRALVIGLGTGHSASIVEAIGFGAIEVAEIAPDIVRAAREQFAELNRDVLARPNVRVTLEDGRNFLLQHPAARYDLVTMEISSVWFAGATNLYSREFYELVRDRLAEQGVFQQWLQLHHLDFTDVAIAISTLRSVFPEVSFWLVGGQGILVATVQPQRVSTAALARVERQASAIGWEAREVERRLRELLAARLLAPADVTRLTAAFSAGRDGRRAPPFNTDANRAFEYSTPRLSLSPLPHLELNREALARFASGARFELAGSVRTRLARVVADGGD